jgi:OHCU decarboxylase
MKPAQYDVQALGAFSRDAFVSTLGGIFEHSPWVAEGAYDKGLGPAENTAEGLHAAMTKVLMGATDEAKLALIMAHPDLAGRLAQAKLLTEDSTAEQASAGLDKLTPAELARFTELNDAYKTKFGFLFIMAIKGRSKADIVAGFERRLKNDREQEFAEALKQIGEIARLRLRDMLPE